MEYKEKKLWKGIDWDTSQMGEFSRYLLSHKGICFTHYEALYDWSISQPEEFWAEFSAFVDFRFYQPPTQVLDWREGSHLTTARWFTGATTNIADNLLRFAEKRRTSVALRFRDEMGKETLVTWEELYNSVHSMKLLLEAQGLGKGDRVCAVLPNIPTAVIGMLATASIGAIWSSASPDFGTKGILDRFVQIEPKVLIVTDGYTFKGKVIKISDKILEVVQALPSLKAVIVEEFLKGLDFLDTLSTKNLSDHPADNLTEPVTKTYPWENKAITTDNSSLSWMIRKDFPHTVFSQKIEFEPMSFQDPVYIMYSSGTTGLPKCIVQGTGVLLNQMKEWKLHCDLTEGEKVFYYTTCGWMMWNWSLASLSLGAELCLFDGNPFYPHAKALWEWADQIGLRIFGTSAKYLSVLEEELKSSETEPLTNLPSKTQSELVEKTNRQVSSLGLALSGLRCLLSTGSPLAPSSYDFVFHAIKSELQLSSISGGTDLNGCFALGAPVLPVHRGELQCRGLGMAVEIFDEKGNSVRNERGELVCTKPFPSMPLFFWGDQPAEERVSNSSPSDDRGYWFGKKYKEAYFERYPGIWCHGDFAELRDNGGMVIYGRSDATLNPGGVRIGTAEIYNLLQNLPEIEDSVIIGQDWEGDVRIVLFVKLRSDGQSISSSQISDATWTGTARVISKDLESKIKNAIKSSLSPRHVPALVLEVGDIPYTVNGKKVELAVKKVVLGEPVTNREALRNPECLEFFRTLSGF